jgi:hypothetical protein
MAAPERLNPKARDLACHAEVVEKERFSATSS